MLVSARERVCLDPAHLQEDFLRPMPTNFSCRVRENIGARPFYTRVLSTISRPDFARSARLILSLSELEGRVYIHGGAILYLMRNDDALPEIIIGPLQFSYL
jgi:hypothetical protein